MSKYNILGICEYCGEEVIYHPGMSGDEPRYPVWGFGERVDGSEGDYVYHQSHE